MALIFLLSLGGLEADGNSKIKNIIKTDAIVDTVTGSVAAFGVFTAKIVMNTMQINTYIENTFWDNFCDFGGKDNPGILISNWVMSGIPIITRAMMFTKGIYGLVTKS
ncbi:MAG: hypothetical protein RsTaC01_0287 [Candidatus Paraimprobicoccus trichonymphae]|uniref:Uncharacterized protein n=1 Tax=Candidatus Paraimprobicoccus trichonymphae TaxID=3033793 RepID=A0AA48HW44_9FIRM|nr:MAG: hypothetical protein RsTaC01_0287 [Candidatus Paraimprobicoccus trichonymphae]